MRRILALTAIAALTAVLFAAMPVAAHHKPGHNHGRPTTTTTTLPSTTKTTLPPTTTTTAPSACTGPVTVTAAATLTGCYRSTNPATPTIRIQTTAPVELDHARIEHAEPLQRASRQQRKPGSHGDRPTPATHDCANGSPDRQQFRPMTQPVRLARRIGLRNQTEPPLHHPRRRQGW